MPGQFEGLSNLMARRQKLNAELATVTDQEQRKSIRGRIEQVDREMDEWWRDIRRDADAGDSEAKMMLDVIREAVEDRDDA